MDVLGERNSELEDCSDTSEEDLGLDNNYLSSRDCVRLCGLVVINIVITQKLIM